MTSSAPSRYPPRHAEPSTTCSDEARFTPNARLSGASCPNPPTRFPAAAGSGRRVGPAGVEVVEVLTRSLRSDRALLARSCHSRERVRNRTDFTPVSENPTRGCFGDRYSVGTSIRILRSCTGSLIGTRIYRTPRSCLAEIVSVPAPAGSVTERLKEP